MPGRDPASGPTRPWIPVCTMALTETDSVFKTESVWLAPNGTALHLPLGALAGCQG